MSILEIYDILSKLLRLIKVCYVSKSMEFASVDAIYSLKMPQKVEKEIVTLLNADPPSLKVCHYFGR